MYIYLLIAEWLIRMATYALGEVAKFIVRQPVCPRHIRAEHVEVALRVLAHRRPDVPWPFVDEGAFARASSSFERLLGRSYALHLQGISSGTGVAQQWNTLTNFFLNEIFDERAHGCIQCRDRDRVGLNPAVNLFANVIVMLEDRKTWAEIDVSGFQKPFDEDNLVSVIRTLMCRERPRYLVKS